MYHRRFEHRKFGRRRALIHGLIVNDKGARIPCLVRNISLGGALLEVEDTHLVSINLTLIIDSDGFEADCEVRHRSKHGVGVYFHGVRILEKGFDSRVAGPELTKAMENVLITDIARR